jgi:hypothetical protein
MHSDRLNQVKQTSAARRGNKIALCGLMLWGCGAINSVSIAGSINAVQAEIIPIETNRDRQRIPSQSELILIPVEGKPNQDSTRSPAPTTPSATEPAPSDSETYIDIYRDRNSSNNNGNHNSNRSGKNFVAYQGIWQGTVIQKDVDAPPYQVVINFEQHESIRMGDRLAKIDYPDLRCGGYLSVMEISGDRLRAQEKINYGQNQCVDGGIVTLHMVAQSLAFDWTYAKNPNESIVNGNLNRVANQ